MTVSGDLEIAAQQNLAGLGDREGPPVVYAWVPGPAFPELLPWLVVLALLALKRNRDATAWWIWAAVACGFGFQALVRTSSGLLPAQPLDMFAQAIKALTFALAALWLVAPTPGRAGRFKMFLFMLLILGAVAAAAFALGQIGEDTGVELFFRAVLVLFCVLVMTAAMSLAGVLCRRRYRPVALVPWTLLSVTVFSLLVVAPFLVFALSAQPGSVMWSEMFQGIGILAAVSFGTMLPFLALGLWNSLYRERLKALLVLARAESPSVLTPVRPLELEVR